MDDMTIIESKTRRKQNMLNLQKLGIQLVELNKDKLLELNLSDELIEAILLAKEIKKNEAKRRINQYIGKLMRNVDEEFIKQKLLEFNSESIEDIKLMHLCELWRKKLLEDEKELEIFIEKYHPQDIGQLRILIKMTKKNQDLNQNKYYKELFKLIKIILKLEQNK